MKFSPQTSFFFYRIDSRLCSSLVGIQCAASVESLCSFSNPFVADCLDKNKTISFETKLSDRNRWRDSPHLWPNRTGQAPWRVKGSGFPLRFKLNQNAAPPLTGLTATPARGKAVDPPRSTSLSCNRMTMVITCTYKWWVLRCCQMFLPIYPCNYLPNTQPRKREKKNWEYHFWKKKKGRALRLKILQRD